MTASAPPSFGLRLAAVRIQDFRSLYDLSITLSPDITVLVGENNSGKTSFLDALAVAFGHRRPQPEDLHRAPTGTASSFQMDLRVEPATGDEFSDGVRDLIGHGIQLDEPEFFNLRVTGATSAEGWDITIKRTFVKGWATDRAKAAKLEPIASPSVSRQALELLHYDMLDARRDIVEELRNRRSFWGRTMANVAIEPGVRTEIERSLRELGEQITSSSPVLSQVRDDLAELSASLSQGTLDVELEALPRGVEELTRAMDIVLSSPDSSSFSIGDHGMGTRSLAALLVFRSYVNVVRPRQDASKLLSVAAFEEPEAHLHPQSQRSVFELLSQIGGQRIISTHSTHVASIASLSSYRLFRREGATTKVSEIPEAKIAEWSEEHVRRYIQRDNPEVLFAKAVGIVEGETEAAAFPVFARDRWGERGADGVGVSLISTGGAGSSKHIVPFLDALGIPWVIFCDADGAGRKGLRATEGLIGRTLDRASPEVVLLPDGEAFEQYLIAQGLAPQIRVAAAHHPDGGLDAYMKRNQGQLRKSGEVRDYNGPDGEEAACLDFLKSAKGTIGGLLADAIVSACADGSATMPSLVTEFFNRLDTARGS